ncbi:uncharacterized protein CTRU02_209715 [Colletotrichum truncatum]|uniref:Uncharacterized protein n=1 Tax=Colletotrichum truncatum TaxID=5467 RepID=A0ACC3YTB9_COLTU
MPSLPLHRYLTCSAFRLSGAGSQKPSNEPLRTPAGIRSFPSSTSAATASVTSATSSAAQSTPSLTPNFALRMTRPPRWRSTRWRASTGPARIAAISSAAARLRAT